MNPAATSRPAPRPAFVRFDRCDIEQSIARRFEHQVDADSQRPALKFGATAWSYRALDTAANRIAHALLERGGANRPVLLLIGQGVELIAAILGVLKAGRIYVPLEVGHAAAHVATVVDEAQPSLVLADAAGVALAARAVPTLAQLRVDEVLNRGGADGRPTIAVAADAPAYIYYTSGTTGRPKGVVESHRNVLHNVMRYTNTLGFDRDDRLTLLQSPGFSGAVSSMFGALLNGAALLPYDVKRHGLAGIGSWLIRERITACHSVPALFRAAMQGAGAFPDLRIVRIEGDTMSRRDWELFRARCMPGAWLVNGLGATECGLVRQFFIDHALPLAEGVVPIGYPVEDMEILLLDDEGGAVAQGEVGEIAVRSRHLATGYWRRPDLTARAFTFDPSDPQLRTYRTGDLGRLRADGCLEHLGRSDARQKVRGQWVDLADVEAALSAAAGVREAAARVFEDPTGETELVAYIVPERDAAPTASALRLHAVAQLPDASVPSRFVPIDRLPLNSNGKVDRGALPPPLPVRPHLDTAHVAPRSELERTLAEIWVDVLGIDRVGCEDSFFDLGGSSLGLSRVQGRLRERLGIELTMTTLFTNATIAALARHIGEQPPSRI